MLIKNYYNIIETNSLGDGNYHYKVALDNGCKVYRGHFPNEPVSPGVCNIQMILECAGDAIGQTLLLQKINRCRLTSVVTPSATPTLDINIKLSPIEDGFEVRAELRHNEDLCMTLHAITK